MKIRFKILSGFILIIAMLIIAGFMSIYEFYRLSRSVDAMVVNNYKTIEASRKMIESLEREDSGILLLLSGHWREGREILENADLTFLEAFEIAKNNITEKDEDKYIERIENSYQAFKVIWEPPIVGTSKEHSIDWYFSDLHPKFLNIKIEVEALMSLNQDSMHNESALLKDKAHRALMPGIIAIIASLVFLIMFNFFISRYYVGPLDKLIRALKHSHSNTRNFDAEINSKDEFKELEQEIQKLINKIRKT